jgi:hypothetical protein
MPLSFNPITGRFSFVPDYSEVPGPPGEDGYDGINGNDGNDGIDGQDGRDGIDGRDGRDGLPGERGPRGTGILSGFGSPLEDLGEPGEFYIDRSLWMIWGPKEKDGIGWPRGVSLIGPTGPAGADGRDGADGFDGQDGRDGLNGKDGRDGARGERGEPGPPGRNMADERYGGAMRNLGSSGINVLTN